jgi:hypothetical protein
VLSVFYDRSYYSLTVARNVCRSRQAECDLVIPIPFSTKLLPNNQELQLTDPTLAVALVFWKATLFRRPHPGGHSFWLT